MEGRIRSNTREGRSVHDRNIDDRREQQKDMATLPEDLLAGLSEDTLKALREFALQSGVSLDVHASNDRKDLIESVSKHFQVQDRDEVFPIEYISKDSKRKVKFVVKGVKKELGQTLQSTGLTM
jgi:hypothetical protein